MRGARERGERRGEGRVRKERSEEEETTGVRGVRERGEREG